MENKIRVFDLKEDKKVRAKCLLIDISIGNYTELIEDNIEELDIQRGKILSRISRKRDVYKRLTKDLKEGAIMPPVSLIISAKSEVKNAIKELTEIKEIEKRINNKIRKGDIFILDGIQRTYCLLNAQNDLSNPEEREAFLNTRIRAELWYHMTYTAILYKMLVLNTGQVKMSMKHQIEILNIHLKEKIYEVALGKRVTINFSTYKVPQPTSEIYNYKLSDIVEAFTSFIIGDPNVDKVNEVVKELERMKFVEKHADPEILSKEEEIQEFTEILIEFDKVLWDKYQYPEKIEDEEGNEKILPWTSRKDIMTSPAVLSGIFASFGKTFDRDKNKYRARKEKLFQILENLEEVDPLKLKIMSGILQDEKKRSTKFGETTRNFFFRAFLEFFNGEDNFEEVWQRATI